MVQANELRIGNKVLFYMDIVEVLAIEGGRISYWISQAEFPDAYIFNHEDEYHPIPLTSEILEKCGFEQKSSNEHVNGDLVFRKQQDDLILHGYEYDYNGVILNRPQYLHQLQNLYFALIGEELTINL
jgi:hypothetical protein